MEQKSKLKEGELWMENPKIWMKKKMLLLTTERNLAFPSIMNKGNKTQKYKQDLWSYHQ